MVGELVNFSVRWSEGLRKLRIDGGRCFPAEASPGFYFALKAKATAEVTALHETVQTAGIPVPAQAARRAKAAIFVEDLFGCFKFWTPLPIASPMCCVQDVSLPLRAEALSLQRSG